MKGTFDDPTCPKCGERMPGFTGEEDVLTLSRSHGQNDCVYEPCDDVACRALKNPKTPEQVHAAYQHWKSHRHLSGCSHGH